MLAAAVTALVVVAALATPPPANALPVADRLTIAIPGTENNLTPFTTTFGAAPVTHDLVNLVYDTLFWSQNDASPEPWLAESATSSPDARTWTVKVRPGIAWHDGVPFSADDVAFTFGYFARFPGAASRYGHHVHDVPAIERAEVVDPTTVRLTFGTAAPSFPMLPGGDLPIIPRHLWENVADPAADTTSLPIGTGPYRVSEITPKHYRLEANTGYFKGTPTAAELDLTVVKDAVVALAGLRTGGIDHVAVAVPPPLVKRFEADRNVRLITGTRLESVQLYWNAAKAPLDDARVRKAISLAIDTPALVTGALDGHGRPGTDSFTHPDSPWALPGANKTTDLAVAARTLDAAGYRLGPDGIRTTPTGGRLAFVVDISAIEDQQIAAAGLVAAQVRPLGVELTVKRSNLSGAGDMGGQAPTSDAYIGSLESHAHADPDALYYFFHSPGSKGFGAGITGWSNPEFDRLAEQAAVTTDVRGRTGLIHQMQSILAAEVPVQALYYPDGIYAVRAATYAGWFADPGHGIFTKRSFLPGYAEKAAASAPPVDPAAAGDERPASGRSSGWSMAPVVIGGAAVLALGAGVALRRRWR